MKILPVKILPVKILPVKILMVNSFHHARGGDTTYTLSLSRLLEAGGHSVVTLSMRHPDNEPSVWEGRFPSWVDLRGSTTLMDRARTARSMLWSADAARATAALIAEQRPDVAHLQHIHRHLTPSVLDPINAAGIPVVWTVHDYELVCPAGTLFTEGAPCERCRGHRYWEAPLHRCKWGSPVVSGAVALEKALHRLRRVWWRVDRFLCPSAFLAETLVRFGVPADRVTHLPNFVDADAIEVGAAPGEGVVYAGRLAEEKGVDTLIEAARRLGPVPVDICGAGPADAELRRAARDLPWVRFRGHVPQRALAALLRGARAVAVPSRWYENFPYAVLEAQAAGRAVVASRIGGIPEQIEDGVDGRLVPPGDPDALAAALRGLVEHPEDALRLGAGGRARVLATLSPSRHLDRLLAIYGEVSKSPGPPQPNSRR